jgi:hypothetical protein
MDIFRALTNRKPNGGGQPPRNNQLLAAEHDPSLPNLTQIPREVLGLVLHEFSEEAPATYVRTIRDFSLVSRYCQSAAAAYVKSAAGDYHEAVWIAQEAKMKPISAAVTTAASSTRKSTSMYGIEVKRKPAKKLIKLFNSNPVVRVSVPHDPAFDPALVGLPIWSRSLRIRCLQFDGLTLACSDSDFSSLARKEVANKLHFLAQLLPLIETSGDRAQMRFEIFIKGNDAGSSQSAMDCMLMLYASKDFLDAAACTAVTKLHLEDFKINMLNNRLEELSHLEHLALPGNDINDERALSLVQGARKLARLAVIDLRRNPLTAGGINRLREYIDKNCAHVTLLTD